MKKGLFVSIAFIAASIFLFNCNKSSTNPTSPNSAALGTWVEINPTSHTEITFNSNASLSGTWVDAMNSLMGTNPSWTYDATQILANSNKICLYAITSDTLRFSSGLNTKFQKKP